MNLRVKAVILRAICGGVMDTFRLPTEPFLSLFHKTNLLLAYSKNLSFLNMKGNHRAVYPLF